MDVSEIKDEESLRAWLESLPAQIGEDEARRWAVLIAHRAAMRVLPEYILSRVEELSRAPNENAMLALRLNIVCAAFAKSDQRRLQQIAEVLVASEPFVSEFPKLVQSRYPSTFANAFAAIAASSCPTADCAAYAATAVECADVVSKARQVDCRGLEKGENVIANPLWEENNGLVEDWRKMKAEIFKDKDDWRFWTDWYDKALNGEPQDWDLLTKVALIPSEDWDMGADHVNALIAEIVRDHRPKAADPEPPAITERIRAQARFVVSVSNAAHQSATSLRKAFEGVEQTYKLQFGCPNETPEELEPFVTLARTYGEIERLLRVVDDRDRLIIALEAKIAVLEQQNAALIAAFGGPRSSIWRDLFVAASGGTIATVVGGLAKDHFFVGGLAVADSIPAFQQLIEERPRIDYEVSVPITPVSR